jgi:hypothetical protein
MELKLNVPTCWEDITLSQFKELRQLAEETELTPSSMMIEQMSILTDSDPEDLKRLPMHYIREINNSIEFVKEFPNTSLFERIIIINDVTYGFIPNISILTGAEWIDLESKMKDFHANIEYILAILYRPVVEYVSIDEYTIQEYNVSSLDKRAKLFLNELKIVNVWGAAVFFWNLGQECIAATTESLNKESQKMIAITKEYQLKSIALLEESISEMQQPS